MIGQSDVVIKMDKQLQDEFEGLTKDLDGHESFVTKAFDYESPQPTNRHGIDVVAYRWKKIEWDESHPAISRVMAFANEHGFPEQAADESEVLAFGFIRVGEEGEVETYGSSSDLGLEPEITVYDSGHTDVDAYYQVLKSAANDMYKEMKESEVDLTNPEDVKWAIEQLIERHANDFAEDLKHIAKENFPHLENDTEQNSSQPSQKLPKNS